MYDLRHDDESLGVAVPKTDRTPRVAMEGEESIAAKDAQWIDCLRDVTQVAEAHAHPCPLADMQPLVPYRAYRIGLSLIERHRAWRTSQTAGSRLPRKQQLTLRSFLN